MLTIRRIWEVGKLGSAGLALFATLTACEVPQDVAISNVTTNVNPTSSLAYAGFTGITSADTVGPSKVLVKWTPSTDPAVVAYNIYDSTNFFTPRLIRTVLAPASSYTVTGLNSGSLSSYRVKAATAANVEDTNILDKQAIAYGGIVSATVLSSSSASITYSDLSNSDSANIYCAANGSSTFALMKTIAAGPGVVTTNLNGLVTGTTYTCRVNSTVAGFTDNNTQSITFTPIGRATQLVFATQPGSAQAGSGLAPQPVLQILDANNNLVSAGPDSTALVTISLSSQSPTIGTVRGSAAVNAVGGVATFTGINFQEAGVKVLTANKADTSSQNYGSPPLTVDSSQFTITAGAVSAVNSKLTLTPTSTPGNYLVANGTAAYTVNFLLEDLYQNPVAGVKPQLASTNSNDTISQPTGVSDVGGVTTGSISTTISGARTLSISSPSGLSGDTVSATFIAGTATKVGFIQQPQNAPAGLSTMSAVQVAVQDIQGNTVTSSTVNVTLSIYNNTSSANLTGTVTVPAVSGVATFNGLGIDKIGSYKLIANSAPLSVAYSNNFQILAGTPSKLVLTGPASFLSGTCTNALAYTLQLQDAGGNPANATASTVINLGGAVGGGFYASCASASPITSVTYSTGSNTKTVYIKSSKAGALSLTATDPSSVLASATLPIFITPSQVSLTGPVTVKSGICSAAFTIATLGADGTAGNVNANTNFSISGSMGSATLWADSGCTTTQITNFNAIPVASGQGTKVIYLKDRTAEVLSVGISDPSAVIQASTAPFSVAVTASDIGFTGPLTVVSGSPSTFFTVSLKDANGNPVTASSAVSLSVAGLSGTQAKFYSDASASSQLVSNTVNIPSGASSVKIYLKDPTAETVNVYITDPSAAYNNSTTLTVKISPSALAFYGPSPANANTNLCAGPFYLKTLDGSGNVAAAVSTITANLSFTPALVNGVSPASFYSDSNCTSTLASLSFAAGVSTNTFYFRGLYPATLGLSAVDAANPVVLTPASFSWTLNAAPAWVGSGLGTGGGGTATLGAGSPFTWQVGKTPVNSRMDAPYGTNALHFSADKRYLYVADYAYPRVFKYDYANNQYIGWIGGFSKGGGIAPSGANVFALTPTIGSSAANALNSQCITTPHNTRTPGWCQGGQVANFGNSNSSSAAGIITYPTGVTDDGTYVYVLNNGNSTLTRYVADTGAFSGWIGRINSTAGLTSGTDVNGNSLGTCSPSNPVNSYTPGWCQGGGHNWNYAQAGDGVVGNMLSIDSGTDSGGTTYIYVGAQGMVGRFVASTGAFAGWIGWIQSTTTTTNMAYPLQAAPGMANTCGSASANSVTPGWCKGGFANNGGGIGFGGLGTVSGLYVDTANDALYAVMSNNSGTVSKYHLTSGAYWKTIVYNGAPFAFNGPGNITYDGTYFYIADGSRLAQFDATGTLYGWIGKVATTASLSNSSGNPSGTCNTTSVSSNTPGWCMGGSAKYGMDEASFHQLNSVADDGNGHLVTGQSSNFPPVKQFDKTTGNYLGSLVNTSNAPTTWTDSQAIAGLQGYDDISMFNPIGLWNDGTNLYAVESGSARVKQISLTTGTTLGWLGGVGGFISGMTHLAGCGTNSIGVTSGWCLGAIFSPSYLWGNLAQTNANGIMNTPIGVTGDSNYIYVVDNSGLARVMRYNITTGAFAGWIGGIGSTATTGPATAGDAAACTGAANKFTPGWCLGGSWVNSTGDGYLNSPMAIIQYGGMLYVLDGGNGRVSQYNASTGAFVGWIGRVNSTTGINPAVVVRGGFNYTSAWSKGGTGMTTTTSGDPGGGLAFPWGRGGLATDGTNLYVTNTYNSRIEMYDLATGAWKKYSKARYDTYTNVWVTTGSSGWDGFAPSAIAYKLDTVTSKGYLYYTTAYNQTVVKMDASTGSVVGWMGGIGSAPTGPSGTACVGATGVTPTWCQGGSPTQGLMLGNSNNIGGFSYDNGVTVDNNFVYISDENLHRITRYPK